MPGLHIHTQPYWNRLKTGWQRYDACYGWRWRIGIALAAGLVLFSVAAPVVHELATSRAYRLDAQSRALVGTTDGRLTRQMRYDTKTDTYRFNEQTPAADGSNSLAALKAQVGTASGQKDDTSLYGLDVPQAFAAGVTYYDHNNNLSFSLAPHFRAGNARLVDGHIVFPMADNQQAIYTLKNNGLKEDIVVKQASTDTMTYAYELKLPKTLEARTLPDKSGGIGIYAADPALFSTMSYGSDSDRQRVELARENAAKTNLIFGLPAPVIKDESGRSVGSARFELRGGTLSVIASRLMSIKGAFTIDPSVVVTSSSDFQTAGNNEGNIDFSTSGQIGRGSLTGGTTAAYGTTNALAADRRGAAVATSANYVYMLGGLNGNGASNYTNSVLFASLNSDGTVGAWHYTHSDTDDGTTFVSGFNGNPRTEPQAAVYNGYLYVLGGSLSSGNSLNDVQYAKINSDGTVGAWTTSGNAMVSGRGGFASAAANGYLYAYGGCLNINLGTCATFSNTVERAQLNADGTVGAWTTSGNASMLSSRFNLSGASYNGFIYAVGGCTSLDGFNQCNNLSNTVEYAMLNSDGTVGAWTSTAPFTTGRKQLAAVAYNGYLYLSGGSTTLNDVQYAPIYASGALGSWGTTTAFTTPRFSHMMFAANGYLYIAGGCSQTTVNCGSAGNQSDVQYAKVDDAGRTVSYGSNTALTGTNNTVNSAAVAVNNGYIYVVGGYNGTTSYVTTVRYAPIGLNGVIGSWTVSGNNLNTGVGNTGLGIYNGFMYLAGGTTTDPSGCTNVVQYASISTINGSVGSWSTTTALPNNRCSNATVAYNGYLYTTGLSESTASNVIQYAALSTTGGISSGSWTTLAGTRNTARTTEQMMAYGNTMYVLGGSDGGTTLYGSTEYARINDDGTLGSWTTGTTMTRTRQFFGAVAVNGYLYAIGGVTDSGGTEDGTTESARINSDGSIGTWSLNTSLPTTVSKAQVAASNGMIYIVGGRLGATRSAISYSTSANSGGSGAGNAWVTNATGIDSIYPTGWRYGRMFAAKGYLYIVGGTDDSSVATANVYSAPISGTGSVGSWSSAGTLSSGERYTFGLAVDKGYVYVTGGRNTSGTTYATSEYAAIGTNGVLTWSTTGTSYTPRFFNNAVISKGYIYSLGGQGTGGAAQSDVQYAPINSNGTIGSWAMTTGFTTVRYGAGAAAYGGYLYIMAGFDGTNYLQDVQYAKINSDGTISPGGWKRTTDLRIPRRYTVSFAANGFLYIVTGGTPASSVLRLEYAPILSNGAIGPWQSTPSDFSNQRNHGAAYYYNGQVYIAGGNNGGTNYQLSLQYAAINSQSRSGIYSKLIDFGTTSNVTGIGYNGVFPGDTGAISYRAAGIDGIFGSLKNAAFISGTGGCTGNTTNTRYLWVSFKIDDGTEGGQGGVQPDSAGQNAYLSDFTVFYNPVHPTPQTRLRGGQTLQTGTLNPLDTCIP